MSDEVEVGDVVYLYVTGLAMRVVGIPAAGIVRCKWWSSEKKNSMLTGRFRPDEERLWVRPVPVGKRNDPRRRSGRQGD